MKKKPHFVSQTFCFSVRGGLPRRCDVRGLSPPEDGIRTTPTFVDSLGHLTQPGLVHAVNHTVCFINDLQSNPKLIKIHNSLPYSV